MWDYLGRNARKPVFRGGEQHRRRPACAYTQSDLRLCYSLFGKYHICKLASYEISTFYLVSVAEETGLSLAMSETPKTGFVATRPIWSGVNY